MKSKGALIAGARHHDEELCTIATVSFTKIQRNTDHGNGTGTDDV